MSPRSIVIQAAILFSSPLFAAVPLPDASYVPSSLSRQDAIIVADRLSVAQTFSIVASGELTRVDLPLRWSAGWSKSNGPFPKGFECLRPDAPLKLNIRRVDGARPAEADSGSNILATASVTPTEVQYNLSWVSFTFPAIAVTAGDRLAIVLTNSDSKEYHWAGDFNWPALSKPAGTYAGGRAFVRGLSAERFTGDSASRDHWSYPLATNDRSSGGGPDVDMGFRTYVVPSASRSR